MPINDWVPTDPDPSGAMPDALIECMASEAAAGMYLTPADAIRLIGEIRRRGARPELYCVDCNATVETAECHMCAGSIVARLGAAAAATAPMASPRIERIDDGDGDAD